VESIAHGLRLRYAEQLGVYAKVSPVVKVAPILFLKSRFGAWVRLGSRPNDYELPHERERLAAHLAAVATAAETLLRDVSESLGRHYRPRRLTEHYEDQEGFSVMPGVFESGRDQFTLLLGDKTHYLLPTPTVAGCPHHDWAQSQELGKAGNGPIMVRSVLPRSFFISKEVHHCAHREVEAAKGSPITAGNREGCGSRSGPDGHAFCEVWHFEAHLCCRTCAFEEVCTKAKVFRLPCQRVETGV
jgi:hypothetical protein